jgi:hypothetical protein
LLIDIFEEKKFVFVKKYSGTPLPDQEMVTPLL